MGCGPVPHPMNRRFRMGGEFMKQTVKRLNQIVYWSNFALRKLGAAVLAVMFLSITAGIVSRYIFNSALSWTEELVCFLMVYLCYISAAITTAEKKHIVADFLVAKAPESFKRAISILSRILMVVFFVCVFISIIQLLPPLVWKSGVLLIHRRFYYYPILVSCAVMTFDVFVDILNDFVPEYDLIALAKEREALAAKEAEDVEAEELRKSMDDFMSASAVELEMGKEK